MKESDTIDRYRGDGHIMERERERECERVRERKVEENPWRGRPTAKPRNLRKSRNYVLNVQFSVCPIQFYAVRHSVKSMQYCTHTHARKYKVE